MATDDVDAPYPATVKTAGIIWIIFGGIILINLIVMLFMMFVLSSAAGSGAVLGAGVCTGVLVGLFGAAFLFVGVQSVNGTAKDTLGNGIGSLIFAALVIVGGIVKLSGDETWQALLALLEAGGLLSAGVLSLVGRAEYRMWKRATRPRRRSRRDLNRNLD